MKVSFSQTPDQDDSNTQTATAAAEKNQSPIWRILLITLGVLLILFLLYSWWMSGRVYGRGIVTSQLDPYLITHDARIGDIHVQAGTTVDAGQPLFEVISDDARNEYEQLQEHIAQQQQLIVSMDPEQPNYSQLYAREHIESLHAARSAINRLKLQFEQSERKEDLGERDRQSLRRIGLLQKQLLHHRRLLHDKQEQHNNLKLLFKLDAATAMDVQKAAEAERQARIEMESVASELHNAEEGMVSKRQDHLQELALLHQQLADAENHYALLKQRFDTMARQEYERVQSEIRRLELRSQTLADAAGPRMVYARNTGVVGNIAVTPGAFVKSETLILNIATTEVIWIDAYIPTEDAAVLEREDMPQISILSRAHNQHLTGLYTGGGGLEKDVPEVIYQIDKSRKRAIHVRLDLESHGKLKPGNLVDVIFY